MIIARAEVEPAALPVLRPARDAMIYDAEGGCLLMSGPNGSSAA